MNKHIRRYLIIYTLCLLIYFSRQFLINYINDESNEVDEWLEENDLGEYKQLFREYGEYFNIEFNIINFESMIKNSNNFLN